MISGRCCCEVAAISASGTRAEARVANGDPRPLLRRCLDAARWIVPSGILALLPKCPACLAAYLAVGTGVGISMSTAVHVRTALVMLCVASLVYLAASRGRHFIEPRARSH